MLEFIQDFFKDKNDEMNKLRFKRLILFMIFLSLLSGLFQQYLVLKVLWSK